ncbi:MAG: hypothetical protein HYY06_14790 [Deltaproteobacteria bacterium]|nr:hypothetical protein [Deltaproteobacteria bacterium]
MLLDPATRRAARDLARHYECSTSEAIRRAVVRQREAVIGVPAALRGRRTRALRRLFVLFERADPDREIRRLKAEDAGF